MNLPLYGAFCVICLAAVAHSIRMTVYLRDTYPKVWAAFGFSGNGWWVSAKYEASELAALRRLRQFLRSDQRVQLGDKRLNRMVTIKNLQTWFGAALFVAVAITFALNFYKRS